MVLEPKEIIEYYGKNASEKKEVAVQLSYDEQMIYDLLLGQERHFDEILKLLNMETKTLQTLLMRLVLKDVVEKLPNNYYGVK